MDKILVVNPGDRVKEEEVFKFVAPMYRRKDFRDLRHFLGYYWLPTSSIYQIYRNFEYAWLFQLLNCSSHTLNFSKWLSLANAGIYFRDFLRRACRVSLAQRILNEEMNEREGCTFTGKVETRQLPWSDGQKGLLFIEETKRKTN